MNQNPRNAKAFIALMTVSGLASTLFGLMQSSRWHPYQTVALFAMAIAPRE